MRQTLVRQLEYGIKQGLPVFLLTADTGFHVFDEFKEKYPDHYLDVGISEATMISMAAGLAINGKQVFVYGIAPFVTMRCFEQIRVDLCYPRLPVKIVGVGAGLTYGNAGMTHHTIEDIAIMSALPEMTVICPGDPIEVENAITASMSLAGPCYLRFGKSGEPLLHKNSDLNFTIGKAIRMHRGRHIGIIATGNILSVACEAYTLMKQKGMHPELLSMHTVKPIDREAIAETCSRCDVIITIEEHSTIGGLGSIVANVILEERHNVYLYKFAIPDQYVRKAGSQKYLQNEYGLTGESIATKAASLLNTDISSALQ